MSVDAVKIDKAISGGLAAICAWCEHYWNGQAGCGLQNRCGGPMVGMSFPEYRGAFNKARFCFICGREADHGIEIGDGMIAACDKDIPTVMSLIHSRPGVRVDVKEKQALSLDALLGGEVG